MKTSIKTLIILLTGLTVLFSCKKESDNLEYYEYLVIDTLSSKNDFIKIDKLVSASLMTTTLNDYKIDINNDSIYDLEFSASVWHPIWGFEWSSSITTLNDSIEINFITKADLFANYSVRYFNSSTNDSITISYYENYDSSKAYPTNLKIDTLIKQYPKIHSIGDTLAQKNNWKSGNLILEFDYQAEGWTMTNIHQGIWEGLDNKFIGIRFSKANRQYYGWIELNVNSYEILLKRYYLKMK